MIAKTAMKWLFSGVIAVSGLTLFGCESTSSERPQAFTGQVEDGSKEKPQFRRSVHGKDAHLRR